MDGVHLQKLHALNVLRFLWVFLQIQSLCRQRTDHDILQELNNLPRDLYGTYHRILGLIEQLPTSLQALAQRSLMLVLFATRPLRMAELIDLAAVSAGFDEMQRLHMNRYSGSDILEACANLLVEDEGIVRPSHFSIQEYFSSMANVQDPKLSKYFMTRENGNAQIATACLRYLTFRFLRGGTCASELSLGIRLEQYPCARYAAQFFDHHLTLLPKVPHDLSLRLEVFLSQSERVLASVLQLRRLQRGSHVGLLDGEFDDLPWPANAATIIEASSLHCLKDIRTDAACWHQQPLPITLHQACYDGSFDAVTHLIDTGHDTETKDARNLAALYYAARVGHPELCRTLISRMTSTDASNYWEAFQAACASGHESVVRLQISEAEARSLECPRKVFRKAVMAAATSRRESVTQLLDSPRARSIKERRSLAAKAVAAKALMRASGEGALSRASAQVTSKSRLSVPEDHDSSEDGYSSSDTEHNSKRASEDDGRDSTASKVTEYSVEPKLLSAEALEGEYAFGGPPILGAQLRKITRDSFH